MTFIKIGMPYSYVRTLPSKECCHHAFSQLFLGPVEILDVWNWRHWHWSLWKSKLMRQVISSFPFLLPLKSWISIEKLTGTVCSLSPNQFTIAVILRLWISSVTDLPVFIGQSSEKVCLLYSRCHVFHVFIQLGCVPHSEPHALVGTKSGALIVGLCPIGY